MEEDSNTHPPASRTFTERWDFKNSFLSIEYPGLVKNPEKAIETLGGISELSKSYSQGSRRFGLQFEPTDPFRKAITGERVATSNLLMKVVKKIVRNKHTGELQTSYHVSVLGTVSSTVKFQVMSDFQYLPMERKTTTAGSSHVSILNQLVPQGLVDLSWTEAAAPIFMSPPLFSRVETPNDYYFRKDIKSTSIPGNVIGRVRGRRTTQAVFLTFDSDFVPDQPREIALKQLKISFISDEDVAVVKQLLEERPVWTKAGLLFRAKQIESTPMKYILAATAYYFSSGPWRNTWVRFGYDPRKDPNARIYQILDYRVPFQYRSRVAVKRSYTEQHKSVKTWNKLKNREENMYCFRPGMWAPCRQVFYQYCDILVPEVESLLDAAPINHTCNEKTGWYPSYVEEEIRRFVNDYVKQNFQENSQDRTSKVYNQDSKDENSEEDQEFDEGSNLETSDEASDSDEAVS